jgi:hypothetical protein
MVSTACPLSERANDAKCSQSLAPFLFTELSPTLIETAISAVPIIKVNMLLNNGEKDEIKKDIAKVMQPSHLDELCCATWAGAAAITKHCILDAS